jgi:hypothetical protein
MTDPRHRADVLLDEASALMTGVVARMRAKLGTWEIEKAAFGMEDPAVVEAQRKAEDEAPEEPSKERPVQRGQASWRDIFRKNWPDGKPKRRRRWRT